MDPLTSAHTARRREPAEATDRSADAPRTRGTGRSVDGVSAGPEHSEHPVLDDRIIGDLRALDDGDGTVAALVAGFVSSCPARIADIERALAEGDLRAAGALAHALRGSSGSLGAARLAVVLRDCESALKRHDRAAAEADLRLAHDEMPGTCEALAAAFRLRSPIAGDP